MVLNMAPQVTSDDSPAKDKYTDIYSLCDVLVLCFPPQMQQQELAQMRQRDANLTALAAIGPRKKRKLDSPGSATAGTEVRDQSPDYPFLCWNEYKTHQDLQLF